jgi:hypothetical protein
MKPVLYKTLQVNRPTNFFPANLLEKLITNLFEVVKSVSAPNVFTLTLSTHRYTCSDVITG